MRLALRFCDIDERRVGEPVDRHLLAAAGLAPAAAIRVVDLPRGIEAREKGRLHEPLASDLLRAAGAGGADPDRRMRLLVRSRPDVDAAVLEKRPSWLNGPSWRVHALRMSSRASAKRSLLRTGFAFAAAISYGTPRTKPASRRPRDSTSASAISSATRTGCRRLAIGFPRISQARLFGEAGERREHERRRRIDAGRRLVMLVQHDLDAFLGDAPLVEEAVVERGAFLRV